MTRSSMILAGLGAFALLVITVGASAYVTKEALEDEQKPVVKTEKIVWKEPRQQAQPQPVQQASNCDDGNIVGTVVGGVGGGLIGNQIGSGSGNTAATIGGAVGGAALGNRYIPTKNVTCAR